MIKLRGLKKHQKNIEEILKFIIKLDKRCVLLTPAQASKVYKFLLSIDDCQVFAKSLKEFCHERMNEKKSR